LGINKEIHMNVFFRIILILSLSLIAPVAALPVPAAADHDSHACRGCLPLAVAAMDHGSHAGHGQSAQAAAARTYTATGLVKTVDAKGGRLVITHDPVPALKWPGMTMGFELEDPALACDLGEGDRVRFDFRVQDDKYIILDIETLP
jgi:Cu/Ag efflux protein CusF